MKIVKSFEENGRIVDEDEMVERGIVFYDNLKILFGDLPVVKIDFERFREQYDAFANRLLEESKLNM